VVWSAEKMSGVTALRLVQKSNACWLKRRRLRIDWGYLLWLGQRTESAHAQVNAAPACAVFVIAGQLSATIPSSESAKRPADTARFRHWCLILETVGENPVFPLDDVRGMTISTRSNT